MKHYDVIATEPSIVQPGFVDVELSVGGHLQGFARLPASLVAKIDCNGVGAFKMRDNIVFAYCVQQEMYFPIVPQDLSHAKMLWRDVPGIMQGSLDSMRLNFAMMKALRARGDMPSPFGVVNYMRLARAQAELENAGR